MPSHEDLMSGSWCEINPLTCPCKGRGWFKLETDPDLDMWYKCTIHCEVHQDEDGEWCPSPDNDSFDFDAMFVRNCRKAFIHAWRNTGLSYGRFLTKIMEGMRRPIPSIETPVERATAFVKHAFLLVDEFDLLKAEQVASQFGEFTLSKHG